MTHTPALSSAYICIGPGSGVGLEGLDRTKGATVKDIVGGGWWVVVGAQARSGDKDIPSRRRTITDHEKWPKVETP